MLLQNTFNFFKIKPVASLGFLFGTSSLMVGVWAAALPFMKERMGLSDADLGFILLLAPLGALTAVFLSTKIFRNIKVGHWLGVGNIIQAILFCVEVYAPYPWVFGLALFFRGGLGFLNGLASNAVASRFEKEYNKKFLNTFHAIYSVAGALGAGLAALMFKLNLGSTTQILTTLAIILVGIAFLKKNYVLHDYYIHSGSGYSLPNKSIIGLSFICLVVFMAEGSVVDWSSIYLKRDIVAPLSLISLGYGGFFVAMTLGRLNGDVLVPLIGEKRIVVLGTLLAACGFLLVSQSDIAYLVILGFILTGAGCCFIVPVLFGAPAHIPNVSQVEGFGMITSGGLIGFLAGPSLIGLIAEQWSLSAGFMFVVFMLCIAAFVGGRSGLLK